MKKHAHYHLVIVSSVLLFSCGGNEEPVKDSDIPEPTPEPTCVWSLIPDSTHIHWTGYKLAEKTGVPGEFDSLVVTGTAEADNPMDVIRGIEVKIFTASINSKDAERDGKIVANFFGAMRNTGAIAGRVNAVVGDETSGKIIMLIEMNDQEREVEGDYTIEEQIVKIKTTINVLSWGAEEAVTSLNEVCKERHTGNDGESVTWSEAALLIKATLNKECGEAL